MKRTVVIAATTAAMLLAGAAMALAGLGGAVVVLPTDAPDRSTATFDFTFESDNGVLLRNIGISPNDEPPCEEAETYRLWELDEVEETVTLVIDGVDVETGDNAFEGRFGLPDDVPGGVYLFEVVCADEVEGNGPSQPFAEDDGEIGPGFWTGTLGFARLVVDIEVEGDVPDDTTFEVEVRCWTDPTFGEPVLLPVAGDGSGASDDGEPDFTETRTFEATGGSDLVVLYGSFGDRFMVFGADFEPEVGDIPADCEVEQTDDGGAESTTSTPPATSPVTVEVDEFGDYPVTFTNTFPIEVEEDEEEEEPTDVEDDEVEDEAEPAEPVEAEPDYTG